MFIKLIKSDYKTAIFVDMDKVITLERTQSGSTYIQFLNAKEDDYVYVKETPEEILKLIGGIKEEPINDWTIIDKKSFDESCGSLEVYGSNIFRGTVIKKPGIYEIAIRKIKESEE